MKILLEKAKAIFDEAFGNLAACDIEILDMRTFMMCQTDYLEKRDGEWKILHEHTSAADGWDGKIE